LWFSDVQKWAKLLGLCGQNTWSSFKSLCDAFKQTRV
jgi:hypothetical protein